MIFAAVWARMHSARVVALVARVALLGAAVDAIAERDSGGAALLLLGVAAAGTAVALRPEPAAVRPREESHLVG